MFILNFLLIVLLIAIVIVMVSTVIKFSMMVIMRYNYNNNILIIPAILNSLLWITIFGIWYIIISKILQVDVFSVIFNNILNIPNNINILPIFLISLGFIIIGILLQAFCYMLINISYKDSFGKIRMNIKYLIKRLLKKDSTLTSLEENTLSDYTEIPKINFSNALIASSFSFAILICIFLLLFFIGTSLSNRLIP